jgi:diaminohydroxyphosphoribosylaminopyrimidine deaminase/5-amino-6-(5-phosphoribosylamino)uracil reductase
MSDDEWMARALALAEQGIGLASPNPIVGCVLVRDGAVIGEGFHTYEGRDHAEIVALRQAGNAQGATAYVTLEPCSHTGRTGPCADALIAAGVARVVVATEDANPAVHGQGIARLRAAGVEVEVGPGRARARALNDAFARHIRTGLPFVTLKAGLSLDGRIAPAPTFRGTAGPPARPIYLTSAESLAAVHRLRHASDAILTGIGTVLHDNPLLTDRSGLPRRRPLLRVVLDTDLRTPLDARLVQSVQSHNGQPDLLLLTTSLDQVHIAPLRDRGVQIEQLPPSQTLGAGVDLAAALTLLGRRFEIQSVLLEGGSRLNRVALESGAVDKLTLFYAPIFLGEAGIPLLAGDASLRPSLERLTATPSGRDLRLDAYLRNPWQHSQGEKE